MKSKNLLETRHCQCHFPSLGKSCLTAFLNTSRTALLGVVSNDYSTALILGDDACWDVSFKTQLREFARALHALKGIDHVSKEAPFEMGSDLHSGLVNVPLTRLRME